MPQLTPDQLAHVETWAAGGATLNQIQDRLKNDFGITLTYLEARLLMTEIGVRLKDKERPAEKKPDPEPEPPGRDEDAAAPPSEDPSAAPAGGSLTLRVDQIAVPGTMASGKVTFSDGVTATWYVDQMGRLGLGGAPQGYQPPPADVPAFQRQLDRALMQAGF
ncbi:MAG TPA: hypothetical protein DIT64_22780 [Verrucomicrobiales bacterium]|nr:hypothetical protein [Verrucomicrobiales bacterium]HRJ11599.1 hypothetical protein [Prosthecobacter sp.]